MIENIALIAEILTVVFGVAAAFLGLKYQQVKKTVKEIGEAITVTANAIDDNKITEEELKTVVKEWKDVVSIWMK